MGIRNRIGAIEKGLLADLIVLDRNPFKIPIGELHNTKVKRVFINGEAVFEASN